MDNRQSNGEGENHTNLLTEHHVKSAIEIGLQSKQQTYQEFMDSFVTLTDEDVAKFEEAKMEYQRRCQDEISLGTSHDTHAVQRISEGATTGHSTTGVSEDDLDTEEIGEGTYSPRCPEDVDKFGSGKKFVQVDNFVDDPGASMSGSDQSEDDEDLDDVVLEETGGYVSSFGQTTSSSSLEEKHGHRKEEEQEDGNFEIANMDADEDDIVGDDQRLVSPLPGEATDIYTENPTTPDDLIHRTQLEMCARQPSEGAECDATKEEHVEEISTDDVQPFALDENFDYDNVVLTPKWDSHHRPPNAPP